MVGFSIQSTKNFQTYVYQLSVSFWASGSCVRSLSAKPVHFVGRLIKSSSCTCLLNLSPSPVRLDCPTICTMAQSKFEVRVIPTKKENARLVNVVWAADFNTYQEVQSLAHPYTWFNGVTPLLFVSLTAYTRLRTAPFSLLSIRSVATPPKITSWLLRRCLGSRALFFKGSADGLYLTLGSTTAAIGDPPRPKYTRSWSFLTGWGHQ